MFSTLWWGPQRAVVAVAAMVAAMVAVAAGAGCAGDDPSAVALVRVAPESAPDCGVAPDTEVLIVKALGDFPATAAGALSVAAGTAGEIALAELPANTQAISVEALGAGGALRRLGKTLPFVLGGLADGDQVPVFMAPLWGACATGAAHAVREQPLAARAGDDVLIAGGADPSGAPVHLVELYQPRTGRFEIVSERLYGTDALGLTGASATALSDGRVLIAGGPASAYQVYDPDVGFSAPFFLNPGRAYHAAVALDERRVLLAGGCSALLDSGACASGTGLRSTSIIDVDDGQVRDGPALVYERLGGVAMLEGGSHMVIVGGVDASGAAVSDGERIDLSEAGAGTSQIIAGLGGAAARLPSGTLVTGFAPPAAAVSERAARVPAVAPGVASATAAAPIAVVPERRAGVTMTALEDGTVLILGGADGDRALVYEPIRDRMREVEIPGLRLGATPVLAPPSPAHAAVALGDGSVLVVGGRGLDDGSPGAWIVRPPLIGPLADSAAAAFSDLELAQLAIPRDPERGQLGDQETGGYLLRSSADTGLASEWLVLAGPIFEQVFIEAFVRAEPGVGVGILLGYRGAAHWLIVLVPGRAARLVSVPSGEGEGDGDGDTIDLEGCEGAVIAADQLADDGTSARVEVEVRGGAGRPGHIDVRVRDEVALRCRGLGPLPLGHVGIGVVAEVDAGLRIDALSARRAP